MPTERDTFSEALRFSLGWEGKFVHHPNDPGGATNYGVTQATYNAYRQRIARDVRSVRAISQMEVEDIYYTMYWQTARCHILPRSLAICHFDAAVNHGPTQALRFLQGALDLPITGKLSIPIQARIEHIQLTGTVWLTCRTYLRLRRKFYYRLTLRPALKVFRRGWLNRLTALREHLQRIRRLEDYSAERVGLQEM
jgi:lysozyme family protein